MANSNTIRTALKTVSRMIELRSSGIKLKVYKAELLTMMCDLQKDLPAEVNWYLTQAHRSRSGETFFRRLRDAEAIIVSALRVAEQMDGYHAEALEMDEDFECRAYTVEHAQEQFKELDPEVRGEVIAEKHTEALAINAAFDSSFHRRAANWGAMDMLSREVALDKAHQEALEHNLNVINQQIHADAYNRPENRCLVDGVHGDALRMNAGIDRAVEIIKLMALMPGAGDAAGGCLYRDGFDEINYLVEVALRIVGPYVYMKPAGCAAAMRCDGDRVWWWSERRKVWIKETDCTPETFASFLTTGNGFYCSNPEVNQ